MRRDKLSAPLELIDCQGWRDKEHTVRLSKAGSNWLVLCYVDPLGRRHARVQSRADALKNAGTLATEGYYRKPRWLLTIEHYHTQRLARDYARAWRRSVNKESVLRDPE